MVNIHVVKLLNWVTAPSGGHNTKTPCRNQLRAVAEIVSLTPREYRRAFQTVCTAMIYTIYKLQWKNLLVGID